MAELLGDLFEMIWDHLGTMLLSFSSLGTPLSPLGPPVVAPWCLWGALGPVFTDFDHFGHPNWTKIDQSGGLVGL